MNNIWGRILSSIVLIVVPTMLLVGIIQSGLTVTQGTYFGTSSLIYFFKDLTFLQTYNDMQNAIFSSINKWLDSWDDILSVMNSGAMTRDREIGRILYGVLFGISHILTLPLAVILFVGVEIVLLLGLVGNFVVNVGKALGGYYNLPYDYASPNYDSWTSQWNWDWSSINPLI